MPTNKKIKILKNIPTLVAGDKTLQKAFETYFHLKHHFENGVVTNITKNSKTIAQNCQISERTLWTRLGLLKSYKLAKKTFGGISLASWDEICKKYNLKKFFYYVTYENICQLEYVLEAKALLECKKRMQAAYKFKVNKNLELKNELCRITGSKELNRRAVLCCAIQAFTNPELYTPEEREMLKMHNSDDNLNTLTIAEIFNNRRSSRSGSYTKQKLAAAGLIKYNHRKYESRERVREASIGSIYYSRPTKETILILADNIEII